MSTRRAIVSTATRSGTDDLRTMATTPAIPLCRADSAFGAKSVKGHQELPGDGHEICPLVATRSARRWPPDGLRGQVLRGITPFPARAWDRRMLSPAVWQTCA